MRRFPCWLNEHIIVLILDIVEFHEDQVSVRNVADLQSRSAMQALGDRQKVHLPQAINTNINMAVDVQSVCEVASLDDSDSDN